MSERILPFSLAAEAVHATIDKLPREGQFAMRLSPEEISALPAVISRMPTGYLSKVFSDLSTGLSGDVFSFRCNTETKGNNCGYLVVRGDKSTPDRKPVMATDTFVISAMPDDLLVDPGYEGLHLDCRNRHQNPFDYEKLREQIAVGELFDLSFPQFSALLDPIEHGIDAVARYKSSGSSD